MVLKRKQSLIKTRMGLLTYQRAVKRMSKKLKIQKLESKKRKGRVKISYQAVVKMMIVF